MTRNNYTHYYSFIATEMKDRWLKMSNIDRGTIRLETDTRTLTWALNRVNRISKSLSTQKTCSLPDVKSTYTCRRQAVPICE